MFSLCVRHLEPINRVNAVSDNIIIINCTIWPKERTVLCQIKSLWTNGAPYELIKNTDIHTYHVLLLNSDVLRQHPWNGRTFLVRILKDPL